uniref:Uncharacterized protein n=1 Tax=Arundo donax TaxID=35708 RepID=A0A0A9C0I2_ARUDO
MTPRTAHLSSSHSLSPFMRPSRYSPPPSLVRSIEA